MDRTKAIADAIKRKALELGFSDVGFTGVRDYPEYESEVLSRPDYKPFTENEDSLLIRLSKTKTLHPWAKSVVCTTLGFSHVQYPERLLESVARIYLARIYSPQQGTVHRFQINALGDYLEGLGLRVERNQFCMPQRIACAEAGTVTLGDNNFAYSKHDGSFCVLVTFLIDAELPPTGSSVKNECPEGCTKCIDACPTNAILAPRRLDLSRCILFNNQRFAPGAQSEIWDEMGIRIHGCDECQTACPRNKRPLSKAGCSDPFLDILSEEFDLEKILLLDEDYYTRVVNPIMYNYIKDMDIFRRNAAVALGNTNDASHLPALLEAKASTENPHVLEAVNWAIEKLGGGP